jgi:hypothetical protein
VDDRIHRDALCADPQGRQQEIARGEVAQKSEVKADFLGTRTKQKRGNEGEARSTSSIQGKAWVNLSEVLCNVVDG